MNFLSLLDPKFTKNQSLATPKPIQNNDLTPTQIIKSNK